MASLDPKSRKLGGSWKPTSSQLYQRRRARTRPRIARTTLYVAGLKKAVERLLDCPEDKVSVAEDVTEATEFGAALHVFPQVNSEKRDQGQRW